MPGPGNFAATSLYTKPVYVYLISLFQYKFHFLINFFVTSGVKGLMLLNLVPEFF